MSASLLKKVLSTAALLAACVSATSAFAHAHLQSETPAAGSTVTAPKELRLVFSEGVEAKFTTVRITTNGAVVAVKNIATDPANKKILIVTPGQALSDGQYQVEWHAVSVDTHKTEGSYAFQVGN